MSMKDRYMEYLVHDKDNICGFFEEYRWLSNFHEGVHVIFEGKAYPTVEHAYQAAKYPQEYRSKFCDPLNPITAFEAKKLGNKRDIPEFDVGDWDDYKLEVMKICCFSKFYRDEELRGKLLATGDRYLEETNHWNDCYWGKCHNLGANHLGVLLMKIRSFWKVD